MPGTGMGFATFRATNSDAGSDDNVPPPTQQVLPPVPVLTVQHRTTYRYRKPVAFGDHRMMLRPRDSQDQRQLESRIEISPPPSELRWTLDVFGNCVGLAKFQGRASELSFVNTLRLDHAGHDGATLASWIDEYARTYPFGYDPEDMPDLQRSIERHYPDPTHVLGRWARSFVRQDGPTGTIAMLEAMTLRIHRQFTYKGRHEAGIQPPPDTLRLGTGSCRDFAVLMIEALRCLGFAARFVSGYLYVPSRDGLDEHKGGGNTHAWVQVYLPGAGWVEFDPTNGIVGNRDLIRVAVVRDPSQAVPLSGSWTGAAADCLGMEVTIRVTSDAARFVETMP